MRFMPIIPLTIVLLLQQTATAAEPPSLREQMQALAKTLMDAYPFLYSRTEFRNPDNKAAMLRHFSRLIETAHGLPKRTGSPAIGSEPLLKEAAVSTKSGFTKARDLYFAGKYDQAQSAAQATVQRCFSCHIAHQAGPGFPETNSEVMNMPTPFSNSKVIVFAALRQFGGALEWIERQPPTLELAKLHMLISLRSLQDFDRAQKYLVKTEASKDQALSRYVPIWQRDIKMWKENPESRLSVSPGPPDMNLIANLNSSLYLHRQSGHEIADSAERALAFDRLAQAYSDLSIAELSELPQSYWRACAGENRIPEDLKKRCAKK